MASNETEDTPGRALERVRAAGRLLRERRARRGMSLVEVMVVIAIILTLMGIIGVGVMTVFQDSQVDTTILQMGKINERVQIYTLRKKKLPTGSDALKQVYSGEEPPTDSWGNPFILQVPGPNGREFDIVSLGSDGREGGTGNAEDIRWSEVGR